MDTEQGQATTPTPGNALGFYVAGSLVGLILLGGIGAVVFGQRLDSWLSQTENVVSTPSSTIGIIVPSSTEPVEEVPQIVHVALPKEVRGIYLTGYTAGSHRAESLLSYALSSHLNTFVIDLKLDDGALAFVPHDTALHELIPTDPAIRDLDALLSRLKEQGIYRIARIAVMRDKTFGQLHPEVALRNPDGGVWRDNTGMQWLDPAAPKVSEYALALAHEAYARGFDEVQFDYVRFASDGKLSAIRYPVYNGKLPKAEVMRDFFKKVGGALRMEGIPVSFDLFGLTYCAEDDLGIGQLLTDVYPYADFISPMAYPSHYAKGFQGFANPALYPYEVVKITLDKGTAKMMALATSTEEGVVRNTSRPWIQDFNLGATYDAAKVQAEIKAARDAGASGWLIWNARNVYTSMDYLK